LERALVQNRVGDVIRYHDVAAGDVVHIPPGTVHALCSGVMIYEVQQSSDLTFRLWDYNRPGPDGKPRALHTERALDVIAYGAEDRRPRPWPDFEGAAPQAALLVDCPHYRLQRFSAGAAPTEHRYASFAAVTVIDGTARLSGDTGSAVLAAGHSALVPAGRPFSVTGDSDAAADYLIASVP
jgi:mannose-6-phosphate isomerase